MGVDFFHELDIYTSKYGHSGVFPEAFGPMLINLILHPQPPANWKLTIIHSYDTQRIPVNLRLTIPITHLHTIFIPNLPVTFCDILDLIIALSHMPCLLTHRITLLHPNAVILMFTISHTNYKYVPHFCHTHTISCKWIIDWLYWHFHPVALLIRTFFHLVVLWRHPVAIDYLWATPRLNITTICNFVE